MAWKYAELSKAARNAGGPDKYLELLRSNYMARGRVQMGPVIGIAFVAGGLVWWGVDKLVRNRQAKCEYAKKKLIQGIKEYDEVEDNILIPKPE